MQITKKGYTRIWVGDCHRMLHDIVWENANGSIPDGYEIHHIDGDKQNNDIENLKLVTPLEHKRIHSG